MVMVLPEVLDVSTFLGLDTAFSKETMRHPLLLGIEVIQYDIGITAMTGREDYDLEVLGEVLQQLLRIWTYVY
jgi:hypothetical protein